MSRLSSSDRGRLRLPIIAAVVVITLSALAALSFARQEPLTGHASAATLAYLAIEKPLPIFPQSSPKGGVAVVEVLVGVDGSVREARVVSQPDGAIADATESAVRRWKFTPGLVRNKPVQLRGSLAFAFNGLAREVQLLGDVRGEPEVEERPIRHLTRVDADMNGAILLDIRSREKYRTSHAPGAINVPFDELPRRGHRELAASGSVVIDCRYEDIERLCLSATALLSSLGIADLGVLGDNRGADYQQSVSGALDRGIDLLERGQHLRFLQELAPPDSLKHMSATTSLARYAADKSAIGAFGGTLNLLRAAKDIEPKIYGDTAVFLFAPPVGKNDRFAVLRIGGRWYLGI